MRDEVVDHCDLFAILLEAANTLLPRDLNSPGRSYLSLLTNATETWAKSAQVCEYGNARMIRTDQYKLIRRYVSNGRSYPDEFYDLQADSREIINRIGDVSMAQVIGEYSSVMDAFFGGYDIPGKSGKDIDRQPVFNSDMPWAR